MRTVAVNEFRTGLLAWGLCALLSVLSVPAAAEDIDIFATPPGKATNPNVLIVLDNTSNWSRADQGWPSGKQGEAELRAIQAVINSLDVGADGKGTINVGLMLFTDTGSGREGGYVRFAVKPMTAANKTELSNLAARILANFSDPSEKTSSSANYSAVLFDAFKYFGGGPGGKTPAGATSWGPMVFNEQDMTTLAYYPTSNYRDTLLFGFTPTAPYGYTDALEKTYQPPISDENNCAKNFMIFISNGFPNKDKGSPANMDAYLSGINGNTSEIALPVLANKSVAGDIGLTSACYASVDTCQNTGAPAADYSKECGPKGSGLPCSCSTTNASTTLPACGTGDRYEVIGAKVVGPASQPATTNSGTTTNYYNTSAAALAAVDIGALTCPQNSTASGNPSTATTYSCSYTWGSTGTADPATSPTTSCYAANSSGDTAASAAITSAKDTGSLSCPKGTTCTWSDLGRTSSGAACAPTKATGPANPADDVATSLTTACFATANAAQTAGDTGTVACPWGSLGYSDPADANGVVRGVVQNCSVNWGNPNTTVGCAVKGEARYTATRTITTSYSYSQTQTRHNVTRTSPYRFPVTQTITPSVTTTTTTVLGNTLACSTKPPTGTPTDFEAQCSTNYTSCSFGGVATTNECPSGKRMMVRGKTAGNAYVPTGAYALPDATTARMTDEWTRFMYQTDVNPAAGQQSISTYTIDVFNDKQDPDQTALLMSMAKVGGGKYFEAKSEAAIINALKNIMTEIQAVNTVFASASLPVNATNRAQNENQVFIGMFRPDPDKNPRWYGNLKRYQLYNFSGVLDLADVNNQRAVNLQTGFISECATSWWTSDSSDYWLNVTSNPKAQGTCATSSTSIWSDSPDGPLVEKGAAAEVIRSGNTTTPAWTPNRTIRYESSGSIMDFTAGNTGLDASLVSFIRGSDIKDEDVDGNQSESRPSLHGDVVHSRPLPVNFNTATDKTKGITVFYGANDGMLRALDAETGKEHWAFVAPEFFPRLSRLMDNTPAVYFSGKPVTGATAKDYFWDGSSGVFQTENNDKVWIFPTMRRGGRMVYGLDVTTPTSPPNILWKLGCQNLDSSLDSTTTCTEPGGSDVTGIGQTWSLTSVARIKGYSETDPVIVMGGGYDPCEDSNTATPTCGDPSKSILPKGAAIYVISAKDGKVLRSFPTERSVASDVAMVDVNGDGLADYAYAVDLGGNVYRVDFVDSSSGNAALAKEDWKSYTVAYTNGSGRKFFFPPALFYSGGLVYVALGSGDREHPLKSQYPYDSVLNRFYVYLDELAFKPGAKDASDATKRPTNLDDSSAMMDKTSNTDCAATQLLASDRTKKGWFMNLNQYGQGEQTVTSGLILGGMVTFSTNRPIDTDSTLGACASNLGEARGYWVNLLNASGGIDIASSATCGGTRSATFVGGGLPPSPVTGTVPVGNTFQTVVIGAVQRDGSVSAPIAGQKVTPAIRPVRTRVYWFRNIDN